jgi:RNA polymerase sigma-70 factor (ECF subfamily)
MSDDRQAQLLVQAQAGSTSAFDVLVGPLVEPAYRVAVAMLLNRQDAEDAVQEATFRAWRKLKNVRPGSDLRPWYFAIVANQCREIRRGRWWSVVKGLGSEHGVMGAEAASDLTLDVSRAVKALPDQDRLLLALHYYLDLPLEQAAAAAGVSVSAAKARLHRIRGRLRRSLAPVEAHR